jgi:hypothetical protein
MSNPWKLGDEFTRPNKNDAQMGRLQHEDIGVPYNYMYIYTTSLLRTHLLQQQEIKLKGCYNNGIT